MQKRVIICCLHWAIAVSTTLSVAQDFEPQRPAGISAETQLYWADFSSPEIAREWEFRDDAWRFQLAGHRAVLQLFKSESSLQPQFRSPLHLALVRNIQVQDFVLDVRVKSTREDYGHRDVCLFFGYQSPNQYYYAHLAKATDERANQIFVVNNADRAKISTSTSSGTPWDDSWHRIRVRREFESGEIQVFFDDLERPVMTAVDKTFGLGQVGVGSFDDTADFADVLLKKIVVEKETGK